MDFPTCLAMNKLLDCKEVDKITNPKNYTVLVAIAVDKEGYRRVIGIGEGAKEDKSGWGQFLRHLKERGLRGVKLFVSDACMGLIESLGDFILIVNGKGVLCILVFVPKNTLATNQDK